jgi:hypothetical protein
MYIPGTHDIDRTKHMKAVRGTSVRTGIIAADEKSTLGHLVLVSRGLEMWKTVDAV